MLKVVPDPTLNPHSLEGTLIQVPRITAILRICTAPVGAGAPAKRSAQAFEKFQGIHQ